MTTKSRLSASVDAALLEAAMDAAARQPGTTISAWVNDALRLKLEHDERVAALGDAIAEFEREHGALEQRDLAAAARAARERAVVVRGRAGARTSPRRRP